MYEWIKVLHLIAVFSWMAGLLYLPRLFVYHCDADIGSDKSETFKVMERRLLKAIMTPAMAVAWIAGIYLLIDGEWLFSGDFWIYIKLACVVLMSGFHEMLAKHYRNFQADKNIKSTKYFRLINEVPTLLMIIIVIMVIVKPF